MWQQRVQLVSFHLRAVTSHIRSVRPDELLHELSTSHIQLGLAFSAIAFCSAHTLNTRTPDGHVVTL